MPNLLCGSCAAVGCTADSRKLKLLDKYPWIAGVTYIKFPTSLFHRRIWYNLLRQGGPNDRMTEEASANLKGRESAHSIPLMAALLRSTRTQRCLITITLRCQRVPGPRHG